ncbi:putative leucine-rich repeat-containing protein DDB_G0290503 isoform X1, partial [Tachysurus ichikawai]
SLQYDSDTAHKNLLISDDQRSVRGVKYALERPYNPRRYDTIIAALTKTGFNGGREYWEVQVKERLCFTVGVAAETAPRKGKIRYSPSNSYWVIQKENNQHYMLTEQPFLLHLTDKLNVIGVLIDFGTEEVAFYNSETRTVLGTYRGNHFTQKLYPFVATCGREGPEDWPIELLNTGFPTWLPN